MWVKRLELLTTADCERCQDCVRHSYLIQCKLQLLGLNYHYPHFEDEQVKIQIMPVTDSRLRLSEWYYQETHPVPSDFGVRTVSTKTCDFWVTLEMSGGFCIKEKSHLHLALECFLKWYPFEFSFPLHLNHTKSAEQIVCAFYRWEKESPERLKKKNCLKVQKPWLQEPGPKFGSFHTPFFCYKVANQKNK